jgi:hypothetical protein
MDVERRQQTRFPFRCDVTGGPSKRQNHEPAATTIVSGQVVDVSANGACVIGDRPPVKFTVLPWRFDLPGVPVALPVLAQVRWVEPVPSQDNTFRIGLSFLV